MLQSQMRIPKDVEVTQEFPGNMRSIGTCQMTVKLSLIQEYSQVASSSD